MEKTIKVVGIIAATFIMVMMGIGLYSAKAEYNELVNGIHAKMNDEPYEIEYHKDGVLYHYDGDNRLFGNNNSWSVETDKIF